MNRLVEAAVSLVRHHIGAHTEIFMDLGSLPPVDAVADAVDAAGIVNRVGLVLRTSPSFLELRHQLAHPANGRVQAVVLRDDQLILG